MLSLVGERKCRRAVRKQSAAILVVRDKAGYGGNDRMIDFRVDDHANPVEELGRILKLRLRRPEK